MNRITKPTKLTERVMRESKWYEQDCGGTENGRNAFYAAANNINMILSTCTSKIDY